MKRKCPICGAKFYPRVPHQLYDKPACNAKAFRRRHKKTPK